MPERVENDFFSVESLNVLCIILQFSGVAFVFAQSQPVIIALGGFAGVVKIFLPLEHNKTASAKVAALLGVVFVFVAMSYFNFQVVAK